MSEQIRQDTVSTVKTKKYDGVSGDEGVSQGGEKGFLSTNRSKKVMTPERMGSGSPKKPKLDDLAMGNNSQSKFKPGGLASKLAKKDDPNELLFAQLKVLIEHPWIQSLLNPPENKGPSAGMVQKPKRPEFHLIPMQPFYGNQPEEGATDENVIYHIVTVF